MSLLSTIRTAVRNHEDYPTGPEIDPEIAYEILRNKRRRRILRHLWSRDEQGPVSAGEIADDVSAEYDVDRTSFYVSSIQVHLPRLSEAGVCEYDSDRKFIELTDTGRALVCVHSVVSELTEQANKTVEHK